jgi:hypothetical protein
MNSVFQKNISALIKKNPKLATELVNFIPTEIPKLVSENGAYNLIYHSDYIHFPKSPLDEVKRIFSCAKNEPISIHIVYGLGLGYLFQYVSQFSKGSIILYEPDLNILKTVFTLVDFSNDILKKNVWICNTYENLVEIIHSNSGITNLPELLVLPYFKNKYEKELDEFVSNLQTTIGRFTLDLKFTKEKFYSSLKMLIENIPNLLNEIPISKYKDVYAGKTALVISAGPTLDRNIPIIKKYRDNVVIFTVGTAVKTLYENGIKPDFLCVIETYDSSKQLAGLDLSDVIFITEPYSNPNLRKFKFKQTLSHMSSNSPINQFWATIVEEDISDCFTQGTVSYTALNCARILGCQKIILVGQDLAYIDGQCYSKDSAYKDLVCGFNSEKNKWEIKAKDFDAFADAISNSDDLETRINAANHRLQNLNNSLHMVKGISGDFVPTESVYAAFVSPLSEFTRVFNDRTYINTSLIGAQIDGFQNISLEDSLADSEPFNKIDLSPIFNYNKEKILQNFDSKIKELKEISTVVNTGMQQAKRLQDSIKKYKDVDKEILKSLKQLSMTYLTLSSDLASKSKLFDFITISKKIDLDYEMKMMKDFSVENVTRIVNKLFQYMRTAKNGIDEVVNLYENTITKSETSLCYNK